MRASEVDKTSTCTVGGFAPGQHETIQNKLSSTNRLVRLSNKDEKPLRAGVWGSNPYPKKALQQLQHCLSSGLLAPKTRGVLYLYCVLYIVYVILNTQLSLQSGSRHSLSNHSRALLSGAIHSSFVYELPVLSPGGGIRLGQGG